VCWKKKEEGKEKEESHNFHITSPSNVQGGGEWGRGKKKNVVVFLFFIGGGEETGVTFKGRGEVGGKEGGEILYPI